MPKWIWVLFALAISSGIYFSIRYGLRPKPIPQLNPTVFETPEQIGVITYHALRPALRRERVLVVGSTPSIQNYGEIWNGFLKAALADGVKIDSVFQLDDLEIPKVLDPAHLRKFSVRDMANPIFLTDVSNAYQRGELTLIHVQTMEATHLIGGTLTRRLQELPNLPVLSISMLPMAVREEDLERLTPHCLDPRSDGVGEDRLACASARISRQYLRKRLPFDKWVAAIERHGLKEYLLFIAEPQKSPPSDSVSSN